MGTPWELRFETHAGSIFLTCVCGYGEYSSCTVVIYFDGFEDMLLKQCVYTNCINFEQCWSIAL